MSAVLQIQDLNVAFSQDGRQVDAVRGLSRESRRELMFVRVCDSAGEDVMEPSVVTLVDGERLLRPR